ncbi:hypothetical protein VHEMI01903 [[Torrubiella] hemipterigena]|uniref:Uncharacterized protein n=1 Tax=[Torrubiella] hemipterigena TaxID=1531966 RepID=A0A0A1T673_9HYPO|nr:hypothetical protein VHEMI01903 [[Torrubiella] hemipterigena]
MTWDAVFLCFDVKDKSSLYTITNWWLHATEAGFCSSQDFRPDVQLLGLKSDLRCECALRLPLKERRVWPVTSLSCCVSQSEATSQARMIEAAGYNECSALTGEGISGVIDGPAIRAVERILEREHDMVPLPAKRRRLL